MQYPKFLKEGDVIQLVAPSFGCTSTPYYERLISAITYFKKNNYHINEGNNIWLNNKIASNSATERAKEINEAFINSSDIIASVGGGEVMCDILEYLDYDIIKNHPKYFIGYSDNTNLTFLLNTICDMASIYGLNFPSFGLVPFDQSTYDTLALLKGEKLSFTNYPKYLLPNNLKYDPLYQIPCDTDSVIKSYPTNEVIISGRLIGGCLDILVNLAGTNFDHVSSFCDK
ncbi:MAG: LD-carboxypeptidase, partial [Erysipelotrichaceae bacterium]